MKKMWKSFFTLMVCFGIIGATLIMPASAYELWTHKIKSLITFVPYSGFSSTSRGHMRFCTSEWNGAAGKIVVSMSSSTHSSASGYSTVDGKNYVYKQKLNKDVIAETSQTQLESVPFMPSSKYLIECDILINTKYNWANSAKPDCFDT